MNNKLKKNINGILLIDKPLGMTSNSALQHVKRLFNAKKAGHTGSLDPLATGMLPLCFGEATKFSQYLLESDKYYRVTVKLGIKTSTGDAEGTVIATREVPPVSNDELMLILKEFTGSIQQIPPMFSAIKHKGKPLYTLARKGIEIDRAPRTVNIYSLHCDSLETDTFTLDVHCSKGTYIRTLAEDIGEKLGCGAHVCGLRRIAVDPYQQTKMYTIAALEELVKVQGLEVINHLLLPIESSVQTLPQIKLSVSSAFYIRTGQSIMAPHLPRKGLVRLYGDNDLFMGVGEVLDDGRVAPRRLAAN